jgi:hypothetical protein
MLGHVNPSPIYHRLPLVVWHSIDGKVVLHDAVHIAGVRAVKQQQFLHLSLTVEPPLVFMEELFLCVERLQCLLIDNILD